MNPIFQSAPNFSEGRDEATLSALQDAARGAGAILADFSADTDHNRCVATLLGDADGLEAAALQMAAVAVDRIDLTRHAGQHPFIGALDVLPFIPFRDTTIEDADALARRAGRRIAEELGVPVYLYANSAADPARAPLPALRRGGFAKLSERLAQWPPDFGPPVPHRTAGVTVTGARGPLLAFNVNLATDDVDLAKRIASRIRERDGGLAGVRALGLSVGGRAQVSVNITDPSAVTLATVYEAVQRLAAAEDVRIYGSELIGGIALSSVLAALNASIQGEIKVTQVLDAWLESNLNPL